MGCDGGTIPRRDELVRTKKKPEKIERDIEDAAKWKYCALTQVALREPIAACYLGRLFNKEAVIEALLEKTIGENENASHIRSMKDIKTLNLTKNPSFDNSKVDKGDEYKDYNVTQFICPVVGIEMNGKYRFCVIWTCGCVLSERALKEVKSEVCHKCGKNYQHDDVIVLNGTDDEMDEYRKRKDKRRDAQSKSKKLTQSVPPVEIKNGDDQPSTSGTQSTAKADATKSSGPVSSSTVSCVSKLSGIKRKDGLADQSANAKKSKSLQDDPKASKVFKSLFTTSDAAKNQPKAHWVTYNPLYY